MKKNYIFLILLLILNFHLFGQTITITPTVINGTNISSGPLNLGSTTTSIISIDVKAQFPTIQNNNGSINIFYKKEDNSYPIIPSGGNGGYLFFGGGQIGLMHFTIYLNANDFNTSGGYLYAEYKTSSGITYKSSNVAIIKNSITSPPPVNPSPETLIQYIPHAATPLLPVLFRYFYNDIESQKWIFTYSSPSEYPYNNKLYTPGITSLKQKTVFKDANIATDYSPTITTNVVNFFFNYENLSVDNKINSNQYLINDEDPLTIEGNQAYESHSAIISGSTRPQTISNPLNNYQWQTRPKIPLLWENYNYEYLYLYDWKDIPNATGKNYIPPKTNKAMEYRRLVLENSSQYSITGIKKSSASNVITIMPITNNSQNTICCNQTLKMSETANPIIGSSMNGAIFYQWQISSDESNWEDIFGENKQNFTPKYIYTEGSPIETNNIIYSKNQYYRRIAYDFSSKEYYISNNIQTSFTNESDMSTIKIYPNPTTTTLNIQSDIMNLTNSNITITNTLGVLANTPNPTLVNQNLLNVDVSNLTFGTYFIRIKVGRNTFQFTFIKN
jgi:hypothetical protein